MRRICKVSSHVAHINIGIRIMARSTSHKTRLHLLLIGVAFLFLPLLLSASPPGSIATQQAEAAQNNTSKWGHWGPNPNVYSSWKTHSNRLIPVYTFGIDLDSVSDEHSIYRDRGAIENLFGFLPRDTWNPTAKYFDQTDVYRLQKSAVEAGKKRVVLFVFDGMDWQTSHAAAIAKLGSVAYDAGRGEGLAFLDYQGTETDFGYFVTTPHNEGTVVDINDQTVKNPGGKLLGGFNAVLGGDTPWAIASDLKYPISQSETTKHAYTDSASSATSLMSGIKTYNNAINVDYAGREAIPIARSLQNDGFSVGVVTSVPISHATPACAYSNNVHRNDYQDLTRDLIGLPSVFHPDGLPGVDVLIGCGWGEDRNKDGAQGLNFAPGNRYVASSDLNAINSENRGMYVVARRTAGVDGSDVLTAAVRDASKNDQRLFGFFGVEGGHLPFRTADGNYDPVISFGNPDQAKAEVYSDADLKENVTLRQMALAAIDVLDSRSDKWWLMVEAGDVDWANHSNNIDNSIGAVHSGDEAFEGVVSWIENNGGWDDTVLILTADHGHYFHLTQPEAIVPQAN